MAALRIAVNGAAGRMGQRIVALASAQADMHVVAAIDTAGHRSLGQDAGLLAGVGALGVPLSEQLGCVADVIIDFSTPSGTASILAACLERSLPLVVATTGLEEEHRAALRKAARKIPLLCAPSMSLAVNLAMKLAETAATALADHPTGADVEIIERHHRFKEDAPSGTALKFGEIIASVMGQEAVQHGRHGRPGARPHGEIGYHALRTGDDPGQHTVVFGLLGETLELTVRATSRDCYAHGALAAARWLAGKPPGLYGMRDVLGP